MDNTATTSANKKIVDSSILVAGFLTWLVTKLLIETISGMVGGGLIKVLNNDFTLHVLPLLLGIAVAAALRFNPKVMVWGDEVVSELRKIVWPSRKDTVAMTIVVCIMLVIAGFVIGGFDIISSYAIAALINL